MLSAAGSSELSPSQFDVALRLVCVAQAGGQLSLAAGLCFFCMLVCVAILVCMNRCVRNKKGEKIAREIFGRKGNKNKNIFSQLFLSYFTL